MAAQREQRKRYYLVGDLARDFIIQCRQEKARLTTADLPRYLHRNHRSDALKAFEALTEFMLYRRGIRCGGEP